MASKNLAPTEWHRYCERLSKAIRGKQVRVEVIGSALGVQVLARSSSLFGFPYEPKQNTLRSFWMGSITLSKSLPRFPRKKMMTECCWPWRSSIATIGTRSSPWSHPPWNMREFHPCCQRQKTTVACRRRSAEAHVKTLAT